MKIRPVGAKVFHASRRMDGQLASQSDIHTVTQTDRYNEASSCCSQYFERD